MTTHSEPTTLISVRVPTRVAAQLLAGPDSLSDTARRLFDQALGCPAVVREAERLAADPLGSFFALLTRHLDGVPLAPAQLLALLTPPFFPAEPAAFPPLPAGAFALLGAAAAGLIDGCFTLPAGVRLHTLLAPTPSLTATSLPELLAQLEPAYAASRAPQLPLAVGQALAYALATPDRHDPLQLLAWLTPLEPLLLGIAGASLVAAQPAGHAELCRDQLGRFLPELELAMTGVGFGLTVCCRAGRPRYELSWHGGPVTVLELTHSGLCALRATIDRPRTTAGPALLTLSPQQRARLTDLLGRLQGHPDASRLLRPLDLAHGYLPALFPAAVAG